MATTPIRQTDLSMAHLSVTDDIVDLRLPGDQILIHPAMDRSLAYIIATPAFRVGDIPGDFGDDIRIALVARLIASGYLEVAN